LVYLYSTIKMMHGPITIRFKVAITEMYSRIAWAATDVANSALESCIGFMFLFVVQQISTMLITNNFVHYTYSRTQLYYTY